MFKNQGGLDQKLYCVLCFSFLMFLHYCASQNLNVILNSLENSWWMGYWSVIWTEKWIAIKNASVLIKETKKL